MASKGYYIRGEKVSESEYRKKYPVSGGSSSSSSSGSSSSSSQSSSIDSSRFVKSEYGGYLDTQEQQSVSASEAVKRSLESGYVARVNKTSSSGGGSSSSSSSGSSSSSSQSS